MTGPLYEVARWWLGILPMDEAGRRSCDETLADWRREAAKAEGNWAALVVSVRAMFALVRCVAGVSLREVALIRRSGVLTRMFLWTLAYLAIMAVIVQLSPNIWKLSPTSRIYAQVAVVASFLPIALLLATGFGGRRRPVPGVGLALVGLLIGFPLLGWGVPMANRAFLDANPARSSYPDHPERGEELRPWKPGDGLSMAMEWHYYSEVRSPHPFSNDLTVVQLGEKLASGPEANGWNAMRYLSFFGAYLATCVLAPLLASVLRRRTALARYGVILVTAALLFRPPDFRSFDGEFSVVLWLGAFWIPAIWMTICLLAAAHREGEIGAEATPYVELK